MEQIMISIVTLLALYVLYSECIQLPTIIKKNKKLCYVLVVGLYFYYHQNNIVEGAGSNDFGKAILWIIIIIILCAISIALFGGDP